MKRIVECFKVLGMMLVILFYPIISFNWYRFCRFKGDGDAKKFVQYGILGSIGILGMIAVHFIASQGKIFVTILSGILYLMVSKLQMDLILKKQKIIAGGDTSSAVY